MKTQTLQQSLVRSQCPPRRWSLRGGRGSSVELHKTSPILMYIQKEFFYIQEIFPKRKFFWDYLFKAPVTRSILKLQPNPPPHKADITGRGWKTENPIFEIYSGKRKMLSLWGKWNHYQGEHSLPPFPPTILLQRQSTSLLGPVLLRHFNGMKSNQIGQ